MADGNQKIRTRFAPSPTGFVHIGSLRTALFSFLFARHNHGAHILRIEDTDQNREVEGSAENLLRVMKVMGVEFDEGYYLKDDGSISERGNFGPYLQSKRLELYQKHAGELREKGLAYYCFCSEQRLEELREEQMALKKPPMYDKLCRYLSAEQINAKLEEFSAGGGQAAGKNPVIRFAMPLEGQTIIHDLIYGVIVYENKLLDDQVILKSDGFPTYHLAVVVDDHYMQISHVIRGDEWIPSTPKHLLIYEALGWTPTQFAHLPLILNPDKTKLSKRQGDVSVEDFLNKGYLPGALVNFVALLGWNPKTEEEIFSLAQLIEQFDLAKVNKSGAVLDMGKLDWINSQYIRKMAPDVLYRKLIRYWQQAGLIVEGDENVSATGPEGRLIPYEYLEAIAKLERERLKKLSDIAEATDYYFKQRDYEPKLLVWKKSDAPDAAQKLGELFELLSALPESKFSAPDLETAIKAFIAKKSYDNGSVLWPLRAALTGAEKSPGPFEVCATLALGLGKDEVLRRIEVAVGMLGS